jgi:hypothetical protein
VDGAVTGPPGVAVIQLTLLKLFEMGRNEMPGTNTAAAVAKMAWSRQCRPRLLDQGDTKDFMATSNVMHI